MIPAKVFQNNKFRYNYDTSGQNAVIKLKKNQSNTKQYDDVKSFGSISIDSKDDLVKELNNELKYACFVDRTYYKSKQIQPKLSKKDKHQYKNHLHHQDNRRIKSPNSTKLSYFSRASRFSHLSRLSHNNSRHSHAHKRHKKKYSSKKKKNKKNHKKHKYRHKYS